MCADLASQWEARSAASKWTYRLSKLARHPRPVRFVLARALWHSGLSPQFVCELPRGFKVRFYPSSISVALWSNPASRSEDEDFVWSVLREGDRYIDAGANIGQLALAAARRVGERGEVIAIEAHPRIYSYLSGNVDLNPDLRVRTIHAALGDRRGEVMFSDRRSDDQNYIDDTGTVKVEMYTLDETVDAAPTRLLKLDEEGCELAVLRGASRLLAQTELVYCELSHGNCARFGYRPEEVEALLLDAGFVFIRRDSDGSLSLAREPFFSDLDPEELPASGYNLVAVKPAVADEIQQLLRAQAWC